MDGEFDPRTTLKTTLLVALLATTAAVAQPTGAGQPMTIAQGLRIGASASDAPDAGADAPASSDDGADAAEARAVPAQERLPLGLPRAEAEAGLDAGGGGVLAIDPNLMELLRVGGALVLVLGLALVARRMVARAAHGGASGGRPSGVLEILARYPAGRGQALVLMKLGRRIVLAHQTAGSMRTLSEIVDPDEVAQLLARIQAGSPRRDGSRFRAALGRADAAHDRAEAIRPPIVDLTRRAVAGGRPVR